MSEITAAHSDPNRKPRPKPQKPTTPHHTTHTTHTTPHTPHTTHTCQCFCCSVVKIQNAPCVIWKRPGEKTPHTAHHPQHCCVCAIVFCLTFLSGGSSLFLSSAVLCVLQVFDVSFLAEGRRVGEGDDGVGGLLVGGLAGVIFFLKKIFLTLISPIAAHLVVCLFVVSLTQGEREGEKYTHGGVFTRDVLKLNTDEPLLAGHRPRVISKTSPK